MASKITTVIAKDGKYFMPRVRGAVPARLSPFVVLAIYKRDGKKKTCPLRQIGVLVFPHTTQRKANHLEKGCLLPFGFKLQN